MGEILPVVDLADSHNEDGRLLKMFVVREQHLKAQASDLATNNWLIPASFYSEWLEEYIRRYAPMREDVDLETLEARTAHLRRELKDVFRKPDKASVESLEATLRDCNGDVYRLRDTLLAAVKNLMSPRRFLGKGGGKPLTQEAILALKMQRQTRLRDVVMACLNEIRASGVGGEVLRIALDSVKNLIKQFEQKEDDVCTAMKGEQWQKLKELCGNIAGEALPLEDEGAEEARSSRKVVKMEGKGTKSLIELALTELGGQATSQEIFNWVESHPDITAEYSRIRVNQNTRHERTKGKDGKEPGKIMKVWHGTVRAVLSNHYEGSRIRGRGFVWYRKGEQPQGVAEAIADASEMPALQDSESSRPEACSGDSSAQKKAAKPKRQRKDVAIDKDASVPKRRKSETKKVKVIPLRKKDPLMSALDAAISAFA